MRYWVVFVIYVIFVSCVSFFPFAQGCSTNENGVVTGAACSIKDLPKIEEEKQAPEKSEVDKKKDNKKQTDKKTEKK